MSLLDRILEYLGAKPASTPGQRVPLFKASGAPNDPGGRAEGMGRRTSPAAPTRSDRAGVASISGVTGGIDTDGEQSTGMRWHAPDDDDDPYWDRGR